MRADRRSDARDGLEDSWFDRPAQRAAVAELRLRLSAPSADPSPPAVEPPSPTDEAARLEDPWFR